MKKTKAFTRKSSTRKTFKPRSTKRSSTKLGYDRHWRNYRYRFLHHNPNCYRCGFKAHHVDHIRAHKGDKVTFWQRENHLPLCTRCHNYLTGKYDRHDPPLTEQKLHDISDYRKAHNVNVRVKIIKEKS